MVTGKPMRFFVASIGCLGFFLASVAIAGVQSSPQDEVSAQIAKHLDSGEFTLALEWARQQPTAVRDQTLSKIALAQLRSGASFGAFDSVSSINNDGQRSSTFTSLRNLGGQSGAGGGITAADFSELMQLIQNVIEPESWDTEGPAMRPYAAGVFVDAQGALKRVARSGLANATRLEAEILRDSGNRDLNQQTPLRKISLTRLERNLQRRAAQGQRPTDSMRHLAGIYRIEFVVFDPKTNEIIIAGPAGAMNFAAEGQRVNRETRQPVLLLDDLVQCLRNAWYQDGRLGCSIDPRQENLAAAQKFLTSTRQSGQAFRTSLQEALGWQDISIHGLESDSHAAQVIVEADYLMKCIGLGVEPSIAEVPSYWDRLDLKNGPPPALEVARWWFTMNYDSILSNPAATIFQLRGQGVRVLSENELLAQNGQRIHTGASQGPTKSFADDFTKHFDALCQAYPAFGQLRCVFDMALVSTLIRHQIDSGQINWSPNYFCGAPNSSDLRYQVEAVPTPKTVMSVVNHRYFDTRENGRHLRHMVVGVGGGVEFDANRILKSKALQVASAGQLEKIAAGKAAPSPAIDHWWWD